MMLKIFAGGRLRRASPFDPMTMITVATVIEQYLPVIARQEGGAAVVIERDGVDHMIVRADASGRMT